MPHLSVGQAQIVEFATLSRQSWQANLDRFAVRKPRPENPIYYFPFRSPAYSENSNQSLNDVPRIETEPRVCFQPGRKQAWQGANEDNDFDKQQGSLKSLADPFNARFSNSSVPCRGFPLCSPSFSRWTSVRGTGSLSLTAPRYSEHLSLFAQSP
ncbi:uncharacterized protein BCR38DRAFT_404584 [Pseudomassariella vexata]|uniref:Uncharacterized protein n=1 Tax=Pseudomassariella vexata TaxID=1141098 RepID=A0A1Y2EIW2_9PEZI|nr:uncharacterized protein BCR38DRAFT_404584 [Pseudomassariella vexata]ORY71503.1 hypothetical protein BCR38DRAFT_404584 [Pseudomassariella vexata]